MNKGVREEEDIHGPVTLVNLGRLTNGIFAFSLLYLFRNIQVPTIFEINSEDYLTRYLAGILPEWINFLNAFLLITILWILTFSILHQVARTSHRLLLLHFGMLMPLVVIPVTSMLADDFPAEPSFSFLLHLNVLVIVLMLGAQWRYITRTPGLLIRRMTDRERGAVSRRIIFTTGAVLLGMILSWSDLPGTRFIYLGVMILIFLDTILGDGWAGRRERQKNHPAQAAVCMEWVTPRREEKRGPVGLDMLEILVNGVFAFTMTLVVKNIPLPLMGDLQNGEIFAMFFIRVFFDTIQFCMVFIILALIWILTFQLFRWMQTVDLTCVFLVFLTLLFIISIPVTSSLNTLFDDEIRTTVLFGSNILICGLLLAAQGYYLAARPHLLITPQAREGRTPPVFTTDYCLPDSGMPGWGFRRLQTRLLILPATMGAWLLLTAAGTSLSFIAVIIGLLLLVRSLRS